MNEQSEPIVETQGEPTAETPQRQEGRNTEVLRVYSRRNTEKRRPVQIEPIQNPIQSDNLEVEGSDEHPLDDLPSNLHLPIAIRKGVRSCAQHPVQICLLSKVITHIFYLYC